MPEVIANAAFAKWALLHLRLLVGALSLALLTACNLTGSDSIRARQVSLVESGVKTADVVPPESGLYVMPGGSLTVALSLTLADGVAAGDLRWESVDPAVSLSEGPGGITATITSPSGAGGTLASYSLSVTNTKLGVSATYKLEVPILAAETVAKTTITAQGGVLGTGPEAWTILPNRLNGSAGVTLLRAKLPAGEGTRYALIFDRDIGTADVAVRLPAFDQQDAAASGTPALSGVPSQKQRLANVPGCKSELNRSPYSGKNVSLAGQDVLTDLNLTSGLGTQLRVTQGTYLALQRNLSTSRLRLSNGDGSIFVAPLAAASNGKAVITFDRMPASMLDTVLSPSEGSSCKGPSDLIAAFDWTAAEPVLFVHGYMPSFALGGGTGTWAQFPKLALLTPTRTAAQLVPFEFHWRTNSDFKTAAAELGMAINLINRHSNKKVHVIAHSFGGVLSRTLLQGLAPSDATNPNGDMNAAVSSVASLVTLGSPHAGILRDDGVVQTSAGSVRLAGGQDAQSFVACGSVACFQMGEDVTWLRPYRNYFGYGPDDRIVGGVAAQLAQTSGNLPPIPITVGIGVSVSSGGRVGTGDYLIALSGQRFLPKAATGEAQSSPLLTRAAVGRAEVTEIVLGHDRTSGWRPGDAWKPSDTPGARSVIVRRPPLLAAHSLAFSRALTSSMSKAWGSKGRPIHSWRSACSGW